MVSKSWQLAAAFLKTYRVRGGMPSPHCSFHSSLPSRMPPALSPARDIKPDHGRKPVAADGGRVTHGNVGCRVARHDLGEAVALVGRDAELVREQRYVEGVGGGVAD